MAHRMIPTRVPGSALRLLAIALLLAGAAADADAKGGRRSGGSSSSHSSPHPSGDKDGGGFSPQINIRTNGSSGQGSSTSSGFVPRPGFAPGMRVPPGGASDEPVTEEEKARRAANLEAYEKAMAEKAAATKAANERMEAERLAAEKAAADRAAAKAAAERAEADRLAAEKAKKRQEEQALQGEVDTVLQRAKADYPILKTAEGEPLLRQILERQKALVARGIYPSVAMVEAVADHASRLTPRQLKAEAATLQPVSAEVRQAEQAKAYGGCRWVSSTEWSCK